MKSVLSVSREELQAREAEWKKQQAKRKGKRLKAASLAAAAPAKRS